MTTNEWPLSISYESSYPLFIYKLSVSQREIVIHIANAMTNRIRILEWLSQMGGWTRQCPRYDWKFQRSIISSCLKAISIDYSLHAIHDFQSPASHTPRYGNPTGYSPQELNGMDSRELAISGL
jgi:hypothetical protein